MKAVKKTAEYTVFARKDGRYAVKNAARKWVNGDDKIAILKKEKLVKVAKAKPKAKPEPEPVEEPLAQAAEEAATDAEAEKSAAEGEATGE